MKKRIAFFALAAAVAVLLTSCGKRCWCYETVSDHVTETETYVDEGTDCNSLNTALRSCVEDGERMDVNSIAYK